MLPLVLGFGNVLLSDDGAGVKMMESLSSELGGHTALFVDGGTMSFSLLPYVESCASMLVIDAANLNSEPGSVCLFEGVAMDEFLRCTRRRTVHEIGLIDLMDMARLQDCLPDKRALLCIQPLHIHWSEQLSDPVSRALSKGVRLGAELLQRWSEA